jgi:hypothetical protein
MMEKTLAAICVFSIFTLYSWVQLEAGGILLLGYWIIQSLFPIISIEAELLSKITMAGRKEEMSAAPQHRTIARGQALRVLSVMRAISIEFSLSAHTLMSNMFLSGISDRHSIIL